VAERAALVTGGSSGIGMAIARALAEDGYGVTVSARRPEKLEAAAEELRSGGLDIHAVPANVVNEEEIVAMVASHRERFGRLDVLVNNAGVGIFKPVAELTPEEWDQTIETNLSGAFYCSREAIPHLRRRGGGYIFNISSLAGINAFPQGGAYNASKFGLNGFSEALMQEVRYDGIRVSYVLPGSVGTEFRTASGSKGPEDWKLASEDVARAVLDLYRYPSRALASRIELRPSQPPRKK
jgi:3-oxoacyl-[acyl-carrier protein] reductase